MGLGKRPGTRGGKPFVLDLDEGLGNDALHHHIEGACRLVGDDDLGLEDDGHGDADPLLHPS